MFDNENIFVNENIFSIYGESEKNENISNSGDVTDSLDNSQNRDQSISIQNDDCHHNNSKHPKVKDFLEHFRI